MRIGVETLDLGGGGDAIGGRHRVCVDCDHSSAGAKPVAPMRIFLGYGHDANEELVVLIKAGEPKTSGLTLHLGEALQPLLDGRGRLPPHQRSAYHVSG